MRADSLSKGLFPFTRDNLASSIKTVSGYIVPQVGFARWGIDGQGFPLQGIMGAAHTAPGRGFSAFLDCHGFKLLKFAKFQFGFSDFRSAKTAKGLACSSSGS